MFNIGEPLQSQTLRVTENEALIESSFRRLIASIESQREMIRSTWKQIEDDQLQMTADMVRLKLDAEEWCNTERAKVENEWKRLDRLRERMSVLWPVEKREVLEINCSGTCFQLPKRLLCEIEGSYLNHMFSDAYIQSVPRDEEGRFFFDFNPVCFKIIVDWLEQVEERRDATIPHVPEEQKMNMDLLCEALNLKPFLRPITVQQTHSTSLRVTGNMIQATHSGWQVVAAAHPLRMSGSSYFEVRIIGNPNADTDRMAVGVCGHIPVGPEAHSIRIKDAVMYNSTVGIIGSCIDVHDVHDRIKFSEGDTFGIKHDIKTRRLHFWHNKLKIGSCTLKQDALERIRVLYPIFALHAPQQKIEADFSLNGPMGSRKHDASEMADDPEGHSSSAMSGSGRTGY